MYYRCESAAAVMLIYAVSNGLPCNVATKTQNNATITTLQRITLKMHSTELLTDRNEHNSRFHVRDMFCETVHHLWKTYSSMKFHDFL